MTNQPNEIPLTQGKVAIIDADDFEYLSQFNWYAVYDESYSSPQYKAARQNRISVGKQRTEYMHRTIMNVGKDFQVDHINGNTLDNRKENLRVCVHSNNQQNKRRQRNNTTGFKGVSFEKHSGKYRACISKNNKVKHLGLFLSAIEAAKAYDCAAREYYGNFACLNFPSHNERGCR